jgi:hypothetical protein
MTADQFAFLGHNKCKTAIAVIISFGVLLLLPSNLGYGGVIIQEGFGQFTLPQLEILLLPQKMEARLLRRRKSLRKTQRLRLQLLLLLPLLLLLQLLLTTLITYKTRRYFCYVDS